LYGKAGRGVELDARPKVPLLFEAFDQDDISVDALEKLARRVEADAPAVVNRLAITREYNGTRAGILEGRGVAASVEVEGMVGVLDRRDALARSNKVANQARDESRFSRA
jgi:hypothetical protein